MKPVIPLLVFSVIFLSSCANQSGQPSGPPTYTISGTVANLAANSNGLVLQNNGADNLSLTANGNFRFATAVQKGGAYSVTVFTQPSSPVQQCTIANGVGTATNNVSNIQVECGHNEWVWMAGSQSINQIGTYGTPGTPDPANTPASRQSPATWTDANGDLWLFGGYGYDSNGNLLPMNDLWKFSAGQWTWMDGPTLAGQSGNYGTLGVATPYGIPGARFQAASWTDATGNFWLFGGNGFDSVGNESPMNDLWRYSAGEWTWVGGSAVGKQSGHYGTLGVADSDNTPGGRNGAALWVDASGDVWVFGGIGYDETNPINGNLSDLWKYSGGEWTWMSGPKAKEQKGVYGTQGVASATNIPGARYASHNWIDPSGNLWLFGGWAYDSNGTLGYINDLWEYSAGQWKWVAGSKIANQAGVYGTQGTPSANNIPGARWGGVVWTDNSGTVWLFGGTAYYSSTNAGFMNDLWKYSNGQWTWISGANVGYQSPTFGTRGMLDPGNTPGGRFMLNRWIDPDGNLWLFGGYGHIPGSTGNMNDLWMYME